MRLFRHIRFVAGAATLASLSAGCGGNGVSSPPPTSPPPPPPPQASLAGRILSGQQPVAGASVTLYAAGTAGYGAGDNVAGTGSTDATGSWKLNYTCPGGDAELYLVATGGDAGQGENAALAFSAALGACSLAPSSVTVDEVTTVASVYALNAFLDASGAHLGTSAGNLIGLRSAAALSPQLADVASGQAATALGGGATGTTPEATVNTLADILQGCAASAGPSSPQCTTLFAAAPDASGILPVTTLQAVLNIARSPGSNVPALYALAGGSAPYQPVLPAPGPGDWLLLVQLTGGGLNVPEAVAIDSQGNAWIANYGPAVVELSPAGVALSGPSGFTGGGLMESFGIAIDGQDNAWVTNEESASGVNGRLGSVTELSSSGAILSGISGYTSSIVFPLAVAIDTGGNVWVANYGDGAQHSSLVELAPDGSELSPSGGFLGGGLGFPVALAIDGAGDLWTADEGQGNVARFSAGGTPLSPSTGYLDTGGASLSSPEGICLDSQGTPWVSLSGTDSVAELQGNSGQAPGTPLSPPGGYAGGGLTHPAACAADGAGNIWIVNYHGASVTLLQGASGSSPGTALSGSAGFASGQLASPTGIAIDASGNVWVTSSAAAESSVTVLVGAAVPVKTPLQGPPMKP